LDVGCGAGEALRLLHAQGFSCLYGTDITLDPGLQGEPWVELKAGDGRALPYADEAFDAVLCMHSLHHLGGVEGIGRSLREMVRVLRRAGICR